MKAMFRSEDMEKALLWAWVASYDYVILCNPMFRSEDMETRRGRDWSHTALNTRLWWARMDWEGLLALYLISNRWIMGSAEPDVMYKPSGDQDWFIRADWDSLLSCFHPKAWISVCLNLISNRRSCLSRVLHMNIMIHNNIITLDQQNKCGITQTEHKILFLDAKHSTSCDPMWDLFSQFTFSSSIKQEDK